MSLAHYLFPLSSVREDTAFLSHLEAEGVSLPAMLPPGRFPTPRELRRIIEGLDGCPIVAHFEPTDGEMRLDVLTDQGITLIAVRDYRSEEDEDEPRELYFPKGQTQTILEITKRLVPICGPLVLVNDLGEWMVVIDEQQS